jgi:hypothetical protein
MFLDILFLSKGSCQAFFFFFFFSYLFIFGGFNVKNKTQAKCILIVGRLNNPSPLFLLPIPFLSV